MKRVYQLLAAVVVAFLVPVLTATPSYAAVTCDVGYTGPDSQNMCTSTETYKCTVTNTNTVEITNKNSQVVASGSVTVSGNGSGGSAASGSVTNTNGTTFSVTITNADPQAEEPGVCTATVRVPAKETPEVVQPTNPVEATTGGGGGAAGAGAVRVLPVTSGDPTLTILGIAAVVASIIAALAVTAAVAYRRARL